MCKNKKKNSVLSWYSYWIVNFVLNRHVQAVIGSILGNTVSFNSFQSGLLSVVT